MPATTATTTMHRPNRHRRGGTKDFNGNPLIPGEYRPKAIASAAADRRQEHIAEASHAALSGRRAEHWLGLWDKGVKASRMHVLESFIHLHQESNASTMEADLGPAAPLLFTRITSWLRLTYKALRAAPKNSKTKAAIGPEGTTSPSAGGRSSVSLSATGGGSRRTPTTLLKPSSSHTVSSSLVGGPGGSGSPSKTTRRKQLGASPNTTASPPNSSGGATNVQHQSNPRLNNNNSNNISTSQRVGAGAGALKGSSSMAATATAGEANNNASPSPHSTPFAPRPSLLLLLVQAIIIFVRGAAYMTQFVEAGMAPALTDCLECGTQPQPLTLGAEEVPNVHHLLTLEERRHLVLLLLYISNAGRVYREMVCDEDGLVHLFHALQRERNDDICIMMTELFTLLGQGSPRIAPLIHSGLVRLILCHCRRRAAPGTSTSGRGGGDVDSDGGNGSPMPEAEREISRRLASYTLLERTVSDQVAFHAARALHYLQITAEEHHFALCQSGKGLPGVHMSVDLVPIVGLRLNETATASGQPMASYRGSDPLVAELTFPEFLDALMYLTLHDNTRFRVEGSELLALAAKNIQLTRPILSRCFEVLDDDILNITDEDDIDRISRRQRLQLSCGRAAVQIILSKPMSDERKDLIIKFVALHGAHLSILKYLRLSDSGDAAAVHDCCKALQIIARASHAQQRAELQQKQLSHSSASSPLLQMGQIIHDAVGDNLYQVLLHEELTEEESFVLLRAAKTTKLLARRSIIEENFMRGVGASGVMTGSESIGYGGVGPADHAAPHLLTGMNSIGRGSTKPPSIQGNRDNNSSGVYADHNMSPSPSL